ncbi:Zinc finger CCCH domain-containing protein 48 [Asimina triloba]
MRALTLIRKGVHFLCGTFDLEAKPVLMSAFDDNRVCLYDLPSFIERGKVLSKDKIRSIQSGPDGLFFTSDGEGVLKVWKWCTPITTTM